MLPAPRERVWDTLADNQRWPEWWRGVERVDLLARGDGARVGETSRYTWRSRLGYAVSFDVEVVTVDRPRFMEGRASGGLAGTGRWRLFEDRGVTAVLYEWDVVSTRAWMNALAPLLGPVFAWNHGWVMRQGAEGLARRLGVRSPARLD